MDTKEVGEKLVALCREGKNLDAVDTLYANDIVSVEAMAMPDMPAETRGIEGVRGKNVWWLENHDIHSASADGPYPHGDRFTVKYVYDVTAKAGPNALAVLAIAESGCLLNAPDVYMEKLAVGPSYPDGTIDLSRSITDNVRAIAAAKGADPGDIIACVLDRPRHAEIIAELRSLGCGVKLIPDGDVAGVIAVTDPADTGVDVYIGTGGAPEGVLAAAALRCVGGQMQGRLLFRNDDEIERARRWGIEDLDRIYRMEDMAKGDCIFAATGVTDGSLLDGVHRRGDCITTESIVMRASSGTVRRVRAEHHKWDG